MKSFNKIKKLTFGSIVITSLVFQNLAFAQATTERNIYLEGEPEEKKLTTVCPYTFTHDLYFGINDNDVVLLQKILNSDTRTLVAASGIGSTGNETPKFGEATKEAVKKFQALFIEYVGIANGRFGPKTRTVMNAICNGDFYTKGTGTVYSGVSTPVTTINQANSQNGNTTIDGTDKIGPSVYITSDITTIKVGDTFRVIVNANEPILKFPPDAFIIDGGEVSDLRKLSPQTFSVLITPKEESKEIFIQIEADKIEDLNGNKNPVASNEIKVYISKTETVVATTSIGTSTTLAGLENAITRLLNDSKEVEDTGKTGGKGKDSDEGNGDRKTGNSQGGGFSGMGNMPYQGGNQNPGNIFNNSGPSGPSGDPCQLTGNCGTQQPSQTDISYSPSCNGKTGAALEACKQEAEKKKTEEEKKKQDESGEKDIAGKIKKNYECVGFEKKDGTVVNNTNHIVFTIPQQGTDEVILLTKALMSTKDSAAGTTSSDNPTIQGSPTAQAGAASSDTSEKTPLYKKVKPNACLLGKTAPTELYKYCCKEIKNGKCIQHDEIKGREIKKQLVKKEGVNNISDETGSGASSCSKSASNSNDLPSSPGGGGGPTPSETESAGNGMNNLPSSPGGGGAPTPSLTGGGSGNGGGNTLSDYLNKLKGSGSGAPTPTGGGAGSSVQPIAPARQTCTTRGCTTTNPTCPTGYVWSEPVGSPAACYKQGNTSWWPWN